MEKKLEDEKISSNVRHITMELIGANKPVHSFKRYTTLIFYDRNTEKLFT